MYVIFKFEHHDRWYYTAKTGSETWSPNVEDATKYTTQQGVLQTAYQAVSLVQHSTKLGDNKVKFYGF